MKKSHLCRAGILPLLTVGIWLGGWGQAGVQELSAAQRADDPTEGTESAQDRESLLDALSGGGLSDQEETSPLLTLKNILPDSGNGLMPAAPWKDPFLPASYDARDAGKQPVVRSQGNLGTCWALVATSALEAALMPETHLLFSADHMSLNNGFQITQNDGGDYMMAMAYLSGWHGPVLEDEDPYGDGCSPEGLTAAVHVQEMQLLEGMGTDEIKQMIWRYGPVQTSLYLDRRSTSQALDYYNKETCAYYDPDKQTCIHDILILGWDDTFSRENFKIRPEHDGAYVCQNSWGEDFGDNGVFYVSYEDANIAEGGLAYTKVEPADNYDKIYQTDVCGWQGLQGYDKESCYFANVYTAQEDETLEAAGFYTTGADTSYEVYVVKNFQDPISFDEKQLVASGSQKNKGYYTVPFVKPTELEAGERFAVVVKITTPGAEKPVAVELHKDQYTETVTLDGKEGYLSLYGTAWEYTEEKFGTNVCLKAYTKKR